MNVRSLLQFAALLIGLSGIPSGVFAQTSAMKEAAPADTERVTYHWAQVDGLKIFYREAGPKNAPTLVLLHGYPSSSHMFRNLIPALSDKYHIIAPDYPGFGYSDSPSPEQYAYTFDHLADTVDHFLDQRGITKYSIYIQDYGAPVGFRLATRHPDRVQAIISQNGNAYDEGLAPFWAEFLYPYWKYPNPTTEAKVRQILTPELTKFQYTQGFRNPENASPDSYIFDQMTLDRPGNDKIQLALFYDYRKNPPLYASWHEYLRKYHPPVLAIWGKNDPVFLPAGAEAFAKDDPRAEVRLLDTGHFALEEDAAIIAQNIREFLAKTVK
ncbi:MAG TPA: alpha/beta hydrolase [Candidatus Limnocylindrales bacterium]|nr:alpha/beta hydrolase [Candidatus Limnocylindrales bacterium]